MGIKRWYGLIGLLSLLGFVGVFTGERYFLGFFAFAVDFQYFFARADEMQEGQILRSAARGFFAGMGVTASGDAAAPGPWRRDDGGAVPQQRAGLGGGSGGIRPLQLPVRLPGMVERAGMITNRIKEYRARFDLKQEELARRVGVRRETIGNLEKGRYNPSLVLAWNIAKVFGVPIEEIFTVEGDE